MSTIDTISHLLSLSNSQYRIYDIGRKIDKLPKKLFEQVEMCQQPYPFPSQGHAFLAIAFWQKSLNIPYLWFVKLPLDEQGLLNQGARNHFIAIIVEALGSNLCVNPTEKQEELLKSNPYHFTPAQYKLAALNSLLKAHLKQPASSFYTHCQQYFNGELPWQSWQNIGVQGIADFAARLDSKNQLALCNAIPHLPKEVLQPLCSAIENQTLSITLIEIIIGEFTLQKKLGNTEILCYLMRALASSIEHPYCIEFINELLTEKLSEDLLITITGRCWAVLNNKARLMLFLENIAIHQDNELFNAIFKDLVAIPIIRPILFACMREQQRSDSLAKAIGALFNEPA